MKAGLTKTGWTKTGHTIHFMYTFIIPEIYNNTYASSNKIEHDTDTRTKLKSSNKLTWKTSKIKQNTYE